MRSVNANLVINMVMLATIVIYSLMLSDVNEQTYQFAMMRALGFRKNHVFIFVIFQAFSFSIPGCILGLIISLVVNEAFREVMYLILQNAGEYGLPASAIVTGLVLFGLIVPIMSILGPTQDAMGKNLRASLDASRRNGDLEGVSATVQKLQDLAMSRRELLLAIFLILFGICTYYMIPFSLLFENFGLFFFVMNAILTGISVGIVVLSVLIIHHLQQGVLSCLLFTCCRGDRNLAPIISKRMESGQSKNTKISVMVTGSISFLILQVGA